MQALQTASAVCLDAFQGLGTPTIEVGWQLGTFRHHLAQKPLDLACQAGARIDDVCSADGRGYNGNGGLPSRHACM